MALTTKRKVFVNEYLRCWNASEAARRADYAFPGQQGHSLLKNLEIQIEIEIRMAEIAMSADEVLSRLTEIARTATGQADTKDVVRALELIGKHHRLFVDVKEVMDTTESPADRMARLRDAGFRIHPDGNVDQES